jgi:hypothetical protein
MLEAAVDVLAAEILTVEIPAVEATVVVQLLLISSVVIRLAVVGGVAVREVRVVIWLLLVCADTQLRPQPVQVPAATAVLQLAGNLYLLGLRSAAPHWLDPLERTGARSGPLVTAPSVAPGVAPGALMLAGFLARRSDPPPSTAWSAARFVPPYIPTVPVLRG